MRTGRNKTNVLRTLAAAAMLALGAAACDDIDLNGMDDEGRIEPYESIPYFSPDGGTSLKPPAGTVDRTGYGEGLTLPREVANTVNTFPMPVDRRLLNRGQERYNIYCSMCHGMTGYGDGMVVQRGFTPPPSFHDERVRNQNVGHYVDVIANGWGAMYSYGDRVAPEDRWAIAAYIRALQLSQRVQESDLSEADRAAMQAQAGKPQSGQHHAAGSESEQTTAPATQPAAE
jgi:mono/diheme cytochrome c family protein